MYPIRARFPNVITGVSQWVTVGYLPHLKPRHAHTRNEDDKLRVVRNQLQQRCLAVLLDRFITASRDGEHVTLKEHGTWTVFPRICLYVADLPEERHILGLMLGRCHRLCSHCLAEQGDLGAAQLGACSRSVAAALAVQLEAALLFDKHTGTGSIKQIGAMHSATPFVPILAAVHGLGTGTMALYKIISFDSLHVRLHLSLCVACLSRIPLLLFWWMQGRHTALVRAGNTNFLTLPESNCSYHASFCALRLSSWGCSRISALRSRSCSPLSVKAGRPGTAL